MWSMKIIAEQAKLLLGLLRCYVESTSYLVKNIKYKKAASSEETEAEQTSENHLFKDPEDIYENGLA